MKRLETKTAANASILPGNVGILGSLENPGSNLLSPYPTIPDRTIVDPGGKLPSYDPSFGISTEASVATL
jgi:hypothetical protein